MRIKVLSRCGIESHLPENKIVEYCPGWEFDHSRDCKNYDWLVVFDEMAEEETVHCPKERTILCTWEPTSVKDYSKAYVRQFGHLLTNRPFEAERHSGYRLGQGYFPPFTRRGVFNDIKFRPPEKNKLISTVCSSKNMKHTNHAKRLECISGIKSLIPELDWYGKGIRPIDNKTSALDEYKYHIAIENHIAPCHWTEKISDAIMSECLTFYAGDPDLGRILPPESFIQIPIDDAVESARIIKAAIANDEYSKRLPAIREARRLIHEKYNFYSQIILLIESAGNVKHTDWQEWLLYPRRKIRWHSPSAFFYDLACKVRRFFKIIWFRSVLWGHLCPFCEIEEFEWLFFARNVCYNCNGFLLETFK
jgi:hypothetical protein